MLWSWSPRLTALAAAVLTVLGAALPARAAPVAASDIKTRTDPIPRQLRDVDIDEHLNAHMPADLSFVDETGRAVHLGDYFDGKHPVIVTMNYADCPMLCGLELSGLAKGLRDLEWTAGKEFEIVTISFDPTQTPDKSRQAKARYLRLMERPSAAPGWHVLSGTEQNVRAAARSLGFRYHYDEATKQYYHAAALGMLTPDGRIARYLYGIQFSPQTLRLGLVESSEGKIGTTVDKLILFCCVYDSKAGSYAWVASRLMTVGGILTALILGSVLSVLWIGDIRRSRRERIDGSKPAPTPS
jgi:protein SCO1/2